MNKHTLAHALYPEETGCKCEMSEITECVICGRTLDPSREHTDTCCEFCFRRLLKLQRAARAEGRG